MPADFTKLNAAVAALAQQVTSTVGVQSSATQVLNGIAPIVQAQVAAALEADNKVDDAAADAANQAVADALAKLTDSSALLASAVAANPGPPTPPPPPPPVA